jgi:hypothetical protein
LLVAAAGNLPAGTYQVALAYLRNDGQESGASPERQLKVNQGGLTVFMASSEDDDCQGIRVYCSTANGKVLYRYGTVPNQPGGTTISNRLLLGVGVPCSTLHLQPPPPSRLLAFFGGRLYLGEGSQLYHTEPWRYELVSADLGLTLLPGELTMLLPVENGLWVGTTKGTMMLFGSDAHQSGGFKVRSRLSSFPPRGTAVLADSDQFSPYLRLAPGKVAVWPTTAGVMVGDGEGQVKNLTGAHWVPPSGTRGTGFINSLSGSAQYLCGILGAPGQGSGNVRVTINT